MYNRDSQAIEGKMIMKKRLALILLTCMLVSLGIPAVEAASLDSQLADLAIKNAEINKTVQQFTQIKQALASGNKRDVLDALAVAALTKAQQDYNLPALSAGDAGETAKQAAQQVIKQKVEEKITAVAAPYQNIVNSLGLLQQIQGKLNPASNKENNSLTGAPENYQKVLSMTATAYAPGAADNGKWGNKTYVGTTVQKGVAAVDPRVIPMGTKLWVEGYGYAIAEDQGSAIKGNRVDLAFNDYKTAQNYGIQNVKVYVLK
jgi:3D (Asp-Asp-Asp) domain-containing protein